MYRDALHPTIIVACSGFFMGHLDLIEWNTFPAAPGTAQRTLRCCKSSQTKTWFPLKPESRPPEFLLSCGKELHEKVPPQHETAGGLDQAVLRDCMRLYMVDRQNIR